MTVRSAVIGIMTLIRLVCSNKAREQFDLASQELRLPRTRSTRSSPDFKENTEARDFRWTLSRAPREVRRVTRYLARRSWIVRGRDLLAPSAAFEIDVRWT
jgi:hypothetical protein